MDRGADQQLDFVYIEDAGRGTAMLYAADKPPHSVYNIATGVATLAVDEALQRAQPLALQQFHGLRHQRDLARQVHGVPAAHGL